MRCCSPSLRPAAFPPPSPPPICGRLCSRLPWYYAAVRLLTSPATASPPRLPVVARPRRSDLGEARSPKFRRFPSIRNGVSDLGRAVAPCITVHNVQTVAEGLQYVPRVIVTDKLRSYGVAQRQLLPVVEHRQSRYLNNRAENSHRPTRRRERQMQRFKSSRQAQDFLSAHAFIYDHFHPRRHRLAASAYRAIRSDEFRIWHEETCAQRAA